MQQQEFEKKDAGQGEDICEQHAATESAISATNAAEYDGRPGDAKTANLFGKRKRDGDDSVSELLLLCC